MIRILFISYPLLYIIITRHSPKSFSTGFLGFSQVLCQQSILFFAALPCLSLSSHSSSPAPLLGQMDMWVGRTNISLPGSCLYKQFESFRISVSAPYWLPNLMQCYVINSVLNSGDDPLANLPFQN